jgi:hypothetical protein
MIVAPTSARLADALSAAPAGETVSLNAGTYTAPKGGFIIDKSIRIAGTHPLRNRIKGGAIIIPASPDDHAIQVSADNLMISDLIIHGTQKPGDGDGIHFERTSDGGCIEFERILVWGVGRDGIHVEPHNASANLLEIRSCISNANGRHGVYVLTSMSPAITGGVYAGNARCGIMLDGCEAAMVWHVGLEANQRSGPSSDLEPNLYLRGGNGHNVEACSFEDFARYGGGRCAMTIENSHGTRIVGTIFGNPTTDPSRGIVFRNKCKNCLVDLNSWHRITKPIDIDATCADVTTQPQAIREP